MEGGDEVRAKRLTVRLSQMSLLSFQNRKPSSSPKSSLFRKISNVDVQPRVLSLSSFDTDMSPDALSDAAEQDCILSQDFFCTPDYITPEGQHLTNIHDKDDTPCPRPPDKLDTQKLKRFRRDDGVFKGNILNQWLRCGEELGERGEEEVEEERRGKVNRRKYVSKSAVTLRKMVTPPPCIGNPYLKNQSFEIPSDRRSKKVWAGTTTTTPGTCSSRYRDDFHEIQKIGCGNSSCVFKVLSRIDGCLYAIKRITKPLLHLSDRSKALNEVQAMAALGSHRNIVRYHSSWFERDQLYIQMELCDASLSTSSSSTEPRILDVLHQMASAMEWVHAKGMAHLDIKPENIHVKDGVYKLGDFGCVTSVDGSLAVEEGDSRYMPLEILNDDYDRLDKVDVFSLGVTLYELLRGSPLPRSGPRMSNLKQGKLPLLPGYSIHFQKLLRSMVDPDPDRRPSARDLLSSHIFR